MDYWIVGVAIVIMGYCLFVMISVHQSANDIRSTIENYNEGVRQVIELQMDILGQRHLDALDSKRGD
jgi:hypothetical protein